MVSVLRCALYTAGYLPLCIFMLHFPCRSAPSYCWFRAALHFIRFWFCAALHFYMPLFPFRDALYKLISLRCFFKILWIANLPLAAATGRPPGELVHWPAMYRFLIPFSCPFILICLPPGVVTKLM